MILLSHFLVALGARLPDALAALGLAALVGLITGPLAGNAAPLLWLIAGKILGPVGARLDRPERKAADLIMRGFVLTVFALLVFALAGFVAWHAARLVPYQIGEILLLTPLLSCGAVWRLLASLCAALKGKKGRYLPLARSARLDLSGADDYAIVRAGVATAARSFDKALVAPLFWYLIGGLPIAYIYAGLMALVWLFARDGHGKGFGALPQGIEIFLGLIPNAISGILLALAALLTPGGNIVRAFLGLPQMKGRTPYAEGGFPVTATAWALKIGLGGPAVDLDGRTLARRWSGPANATAQLDPGYLLRALYLSAVATLLLAGALALGWLAAIHAQPPPAPARPVPAVHAVAKP